MSNQKYTIYQRLTKMFGYNGQPIPTNNSYNFSKNDLLKTDSKDEYDKTLLQSQQSQYITDKWAKLDQSLYNQSVYYEANRLAAYYDFESMEFSIHGDTNIATPNGFITIKELADKGRDYEFTVYAYDHNQKKVVPAIARNAHFTRNEMTYKITFDDGSHIIATYGHRFLKRNGEFCVVEELKEGDSMMPFYRKDNSIYTFNVNQGENGWVDENTLLKDLKNININFNPIPWDLIVEKALKFKDLLICSKELKIDYEVLLKIISDGGFNNWETFINAYNNQDNNLFYDEKSLIISIEPFGVVPVYDLTVPGYKNFATDTIFSHNTPEISAALDIFSEESCIIGNSKIPLLNGETKTVEELYNNNTENFWVYAVDINNDKIKPSKVEKVIFKGEKDTYKITLDDDSEIICTSDHKWLDINNNWVETKDLVFGSKLKSIYRKIDKKGYEKISLKDSNYNFTHSIVGESELINEKQKLIDLSSKHLIVLHHKSFNKRNNEPSQLEYMLWNDHQKLHTDLNKKRWENEEFANKMKNIFSETAKKTWSDVKKKKMMSQKFSISIKKYFDGLTTEEKKRIYGKKGELNNNWQSGLFKGKNNPNYSKEKNHFDDINENDYINYILTLKNDYRKPLVEKFNMTENGVIEYNKYLCKKYNIPSIHLLRFKIGDKYSITDIKNFMSNEKYPKIKLNKYCLQNSINKNKLTTFIKSKGYRNWCNLVDSVNNHRVISIEYYGKEKVYDLLNSSVDSNFAIECNNGMIISHNCQVSEKGEMLTIFSESDRIKTVLEDLFKNKLDINTNLPMWTRGMCKYGDDFVYLKIDPNDGIIGCQQLPNIEIERIEGGSYLTNKSDNMSQSRELRFAWKNRDMEFQNWEIAHFRLLGDDRKLPYGTCLKYNTRIEIENGYKEIKDIVVGDMVWSFDLINQEKVLSKVLDTVNSGVKETFKLSTKYNSIEVSKEHRILYLNKETYNFEYKNTLDFKVGDLLVLDSIKNNIEKFLTEPIISIEKSGNFETYDIYVENENHNFYANGVVVHNSILDKIRRIWKQLLLAEDAMLIYRTTRAPERRVFKVFVGNMDDKDIESYVQRVANKFKRDQVVDQKTGQVDMRYNQMPVWSKTPIPLLDGRTITIEELAKEYEEGKQNWVYSIQDKTFAVVPGKVIWCGKNYTANKLIKVWLDDETWVLTAPEHPFILRDGKKVNAEDLKEGDSLMPYYVKKSNEKDGLKIKDYEMIYNPKNGKYQFVHRLVSNSALSKEREQCRKETSFKINNNLTVHHIDFNKNNNSVENLLWIGNVDHIKLHSEYGRINITKYNKSEKKRERNKYLAKRDSWHLRMTSYNHSELHKEHNSIRREAQIKDWSNPEKKLERSVGMRVLLDDNFFEKINEKIISREIINRKTMMEFLSTDIIDYIISINNNKRLNKIKLVNRCVLERHIINKGFKTITDYIDEIKKNHKVSRIETIYENEDVYCMTVVGINGEEDRHNFALKSFKNDKIVSESGVFVSNSVDQDFFIPVRDIAQQNPIETLPGACISLETEIPLLDGRTLKLSEIINEWDNGNKDLWVYSANPLTGELAPGLITWAGITRKNTNVLKITLDNGEEIISTPDHKFVHRTNGFVEAKDLNIGDSLMPFYRDEEFILKKKYAKKYDRVWDSSKQKWIFTHRMVNNFMKNLGLETYTTFDGEFEKENMKTIHHKDNNRKNNNPTNLTLMESKDHYKYHRFLLWETEEKSKINKEKISNGIKKYIENLSEEQKKERYKKNILSDNAIKITTKNLIEWRKNENNNKKVGSLISKAYTDKRKKKHSLNNIENWKNNEFRKKVFSKKQTITFSDEIYNKFLKVFETNLRADKTLKILNDDSEFMSLFIDINKDIRSSLTNLNEFTLNHVDKMFKQLGYNNFCEWKKSELKKRGFKNMVAWKYYVDKQNKLYNHKIIDIEYLEEKLDTGTITVDNSEIYHNYHTFAIKSGVFIKNSNLGEIQDIEYLQKKMLAALRVPKAFLGFEDVVGEGKSLALMDIRFARTINKVQKSLVHELNKIALLHLLILGFEDELNNFTLSLTNPSSQSDLLKIEQWKEKITLYKDATSDQSQLGILPVSHTWAKKNILGMSESEVLLDLQQQRLERALGFELSNTQQVIKRTRVFDQVDAKYGISEEDRKKLDATADTEGGDSMGLGSTAPSAPTDGGEALSEDINLFSVIKDKEYLIFDNNKSTEIINELNDKIKDIIK